MQRDRKQNLNALLMFDKQDLSYHNKYAVNTWVN